MVVELVDNLTLDLDPRGRVYVLARGEACGSASSHTGQECHRRRCGTTNGWVLSFRCAVVTASATTTPTRSGSSPKSGSSPPAASHRQGGTVRGVLAGRSPAKRRMPRVVGGL